MLEKESKSSQKDDAAAFNKRFKYALIAFAVIELIVTGFAVYHKFA